MQQWFTLSNPVMVEAFFDLPVFRQFAQLDQSASMPDESTILRFSRRLEMLGDQILATVNVLLIQRGLSLKTGMKCLYQGIHKFPDARSDVTQHVAVRASICRALDKSDQFDQLINKADSNVKCNTQIFNG